MAFQRAWIVFVLGISSAWGCRESQATSSAGAAETTERAPEQEPVTIRFAGEGNEGPLAYARREGILERELAKVNAKIEWVPSVGAFSASFEAMNSGAINTARAAVSPIVGALAHNLQFKIFSISDPGGVRQAGIVAHKDSAISSLKDLVGKRVAVNHAAHGDYVLLRALEKAGVPADKVIRVPIQPPDAAAAFATGKIDAWSTFGVFFVTAVKNGGRVLAYESDIQSDDVGVISANADTLKRNPEAFKVFLKVIEDVTRLGHRAPEKLQNVFTDKGPTAVTGELLKENIEETRRAPIFRVPTAADRARVAAVAKLLHDNGSIDKPFEVDDIVFDLDAAIRAKGGPR